MRCRGRNPTPEISELTRKRSLESRTNESAAGLKFAWRRRHRRSPAAEFRRNHLQLPCSSILALRERNPTGPWTRVTKSFGPASALFPDAPPFELALPEIVLASFA